MAQTSASPVVPNASNAARHDRNSAKTTARTTAKRTTKRAKTAVAKVKLTKASRVAAVAPPGYEIRERATRLWAQGGRRDGTAFGDWITAERQLYQERGIQV